MNIADFPERVPLPTMVLLAVITLTAIAIPIFAFQTCRKQLFARWQGIFPGIANFLIVEYALCNFFLLYIFLVPAIKNFSDNYRLSSSMLHCLAVAVIAELGRYFFLHRTMKTYSNIGTAAMFSVGTATTRSLFLVASYSLQSLLVAMTINDAGMTVLYENAGEEGEALLTALSTLFTTHPATYIMLAFDVPISFMMHLICTLLFFMVISNKLPKNYIYYGIAFRFIYEIPNYLYSYQVLISNIYVMTIATAIITICAGYFTWNIAKNNLSEELMNLKNQRLTKKPSFPKFNANIHR